MRILYLPHFETSSDSDFCRALRSAAPFSDIRVGYLLPAYSSRWELYGHWWPRLFWYGLRSALRATHDVVVAWSHLVLVPFVVLRMFGLIRCRLVLVGLIYTPRRCRWTRIAHRAYLRFMTHRIDLTFVHSTHEIEEYSRVFQLPPQRFAYLPASAHMSVWPAVTNSSEPFVASAGRSNRDYDTLIEAAPDLGMPVVIVSDSWKRQDMPVNVEVRSNCFGGDYLRLLAAASVVVIPLKEDALSSGQMVLLHAMALGRPIVVTRTQGTIDYVEDGHTALFMERGSASSLTEQVRKLLRDPDLAAHLVREARRRYLERHTLEAGLRMLCERMDRHFLGDTGS